MGRSGATGACPSRGPFPGSWTASADEFADHAALVTDDRELTFAQLRAEVRQAAAAMIDLGVKAGDRVAIWSPNTWHWVVACLATHYAGAVVVPLNTRYTASEATDILARTEAPLLIGMGEFLGADRAARPRSRRTARAAPRRPGARSRRTTALGTTSWLAARTSTAVDARVAALSPDDVSDILFTSGTTGRSKGVLCAHRQSLDAPAAWAACGQLTSADRYLCINPFFHNFGYKAGILACLQTGATLVPQLTFDPEKAMRAVQDHRITVLPGPPTIYQTLLDHPKRGDYDLTSLRFAVTGAAIIPVVLIERMQAELDIDIVLTAYGLTEASGFGTMCRADDDAVTVATTSGRPIAEFELADRRTDTGEVLLRGPNVMLGYLDDPDATAEAIDADGWLHTGDIGSLDENGNLRITDRLKDMYICGGFNVYPAEIEQVLARLDGVADSAVIGVPDERLGEVGKAFVVLKPGAELDEQAVIAHAREHLANFKTPRSVAFIDVLPRNPGGKVVKPQLREMV